MNLGLYFDIKLCTHGDDRVVAYLVDYNEDTVVVEAECATRISGSKESVERYFGRQGGLSYARLDKLTAFDELSKAPVQYATQARDAWTGVTFAWKRFIPEFMGAGVGLDEILIAMENSGYTQDEINEAMRETI